MVEGELLEAERLFGGFMKKIIEEDRASERLFRWGLIAIWHNDERMIEAELCVDRFRFFEGLDRLPVVEVAVAREEEGGLDLTEAIEHAIHTKIGRGRREDGAKARGREHHDDRLGEVWEICRDAIANLHARGAHGSL